MTPGNDDFWEVDDVIRASERVRFVEGLCVSVDDHHGMFTTGYSNLTPWRTEREVSERTLLADRPMWKASIRQTPSPLSLPPVDSDLAVRRARSGAEPENGGRRDPDDPCRLLRGPTWIEGEEPLLGLFGHVHESKAAEKSAARSA